MRLRSRQTRVLALTAVVGVGVPLALVTSATTPAVATKSTRYQMQLPFKQLMQAHGESEGAAYLKGRERYIEARYLAGTKPLSPEQAATYRASAASKYGRTRHVAAAPQQYLNTPTSAPSWSSVGPSSVFQVGRTSNTFQRVSGRVSALAVNNQGDIYAGGAQGGLWRRDHVTHEWTALTDNLPTLSVGAVAIAPSNQNIIYLATGEGDLSGDSYYGDGVWRSADAGATWTHVSGTQFPATSITRLLVDPHNANTVYVATIRGRGGSRRVSPPTSQTWGIYRSDNGGSSWRLLKGTTDPNRGATDLEFDPTRPGALFATFWNDGVYRSGTDQVGWQNITTKIAKAINIKPNFSGSRFSIATAKVGKATRIYAGFDWTNATNGVHRSSRLFRSDDDGEHWTQLPFGTPGDPDSVLNYCDIQCTYDNVVEVDPSNPNIVYAAGEYTYTNSPQLGGIYQSTDGGLTWQTLGVDLHPDFHALAMQPNDPAHVVIGNDGGVWDSPDRGGRVAGPITDCLSAWFNNTGPACVDWADLNKGLGIAQADSVAYANADNPDTFWSGTQDNGTQSTLPPSAGWPYGTTWVDNSSGDGGQVVVDHSNPNFVFGTYYQLTGLYRFSHAQDDLNTGNLPTFTASNIMNGIDKTDRSEFYIPLTLDQGDTSKLLTGTYRVYRTDNAEAPVASDVQWQPISGDLTSGCTGSASNGGRGCVISALGMSDGGTGGYAGTEEGWVWHADDMLSSTGNANWVRSDAAGAVLPGRPVGSFAVDKSNWRTAYVSFEGYNAATPGVSGHVFKTTDGGQTWTNVTGNLPDNPVNSLLLDPSDPNTLYAGSDVGAFVTHDGGTSWAPIGNGLPRVNVWQMDYDPSRAMLVAGTHGRGTWTLDTAAHAPAFVASISDPGTPVGPGVDLPYTITIKNIGNADATGVTVTDPVPDHTTVKSSDNGGAPDGSGNVVWNGLTIPAGGSVDLHLTVTIAPDLDPAVTQIVNDGLTVTSVEGPGTSGSPHVNPISPQFAVSATPASELRSAQLGDTTTLTYKVTNQGYGTEAFDLSLAGNSWTTVVKPGCSTEASSTDVLAPGDSEKVCVDVTVPPDATALTSDEFTLTVSPANSSDTSLDKDVTGTTVALNKPVLLVDEDGQTSGAADAQSFYTAALNAAGVQYDVLDLATTSLPDGYLNGYKEVYWFTGTSYPTPLSAYEKTLTTYLDAGGKLFMDGMDLLDQSGGTSPFAKNYLHVDWDGSEVQNDKSTTQVHGVASTVIGDGLAYDLTHFAAYGAFEDEITPNGPAVAEFKDDSGAADGLSVTDTSHNSGSSYKVVFFAFPLEEVGTATDRSDIVTRIESYFNAP
jgi:uncharacterized repeat protein (TIGR01451 family)